MFLHFWISEILISLQSETEQRAHKISFYINKEKAQQVMKGLSERLEKRGVIVCTFAKQDIAQLFYFS